MMWLLVNYRYEYVHVEGGGCVEWTVEVFVCDHITPLCNILYWFLGKIQTLQIWLIKLFMIRCGLCLHFISSHLPDIYICVCVCVCMICIRMCTICCIYFTYVLSVQLPHAPLSQAAVPHTFCFSVWHALHPSPGSYLLILQVPNS